MSHTPTPWNVVVKDKIFIYGGNNKLVAHVCEPADAVYLADAVLNHDRITAEVGMLRDVLHSIHLRAELAEADGVHMRGALGNIKDDAAKALNPEEPK